MKTSRSRSGSTELDENKLFREFSLGINTLEIGDALKKAHSVLQRFMPTDRMGLYYIAEDRRHSYVAAELKDGVDVVIPGALTPFAVVDPKHMQYVEQEDRQGIVTIRNTRDSFSEHERKVFPWLASCSCIALRLHVQDEVIGFLVISVQGFNKYRPEHKRILEIVHEPMAVALRNVRQYQETLRLKNLLADDYKALSMDLEPFAGSQVVGAEFGLRQAMEMVRQVAPLTSPVLLLGETGTGKEVIATAIHSASTRREKPIIRVQCGAIPETLLDSELFGHEKGAFTGAMEQKRGRFERAHGGTIFLDEIGELSPSAQVKLLRVLQEKQFERLGGAQTITVDVRVIAATHRDLKEMVRKGDFREDLWFRLNVFPVNLPPLRHRKNDIPSLVHYFVEKKAREMNLPAPSSIAVGAMERLLEYEWPGNVRELQNVVERALILSQGRPLDFPPFASAEPVTVSPVGSAPAVTIRSLSDVTADHIKKTLIHARGQVSGPGGAAELLGINASTLRSRMRKLGIAFGRARSSGNAMLP